MIEPGYEILEHTADIGIHAWGPTLASVYGQAAEALTDILGARAQAPIEGARTMDVTASDREALLVAFLNELILFHETEEVAFRDIGFSGPVTDTSLQAEVCYGSLPGETETTGVKAATYHRLEIREVEGGFEARVYLDV